uniref:hypothetical protein n=1 Tax=Flavobacterium sp. TaxID=239 RepID=UPI00404AA093
MKLFKKKYKFLYIFFVFTSQFIFGQEIIDGAKYDYDLIDKYLIEKHQINSSSKSLNILFSSNDCKMCISYLQNVLNEANTSNLIFNIFTDNIVYAKKHLSKYNLKLNYIFDNTIFSLFDIESKTIIYLKEDNKITFNISDIIVNLNKSDEIALIVIDTLLTDNNISSTLLPYQKILTYDSKMETAILFEKENKKQEFTKIQYLYPKINDSIKLYKLDERINNKTKFQNIDFQSFEKLLLANSLRYVEVQSFASFENIIYCTFILNRLYENLEKKDNFSYIGNSFIATKKINSENDIYDVMDVSSYDNYYLIDVFNFKNTIYPVSVYIYDNFKVVNENTIKIKVNKQIEDKHKLEFGGEITFTLNPLKNSTSVKELNENVEKKFVRINTVLCNDFYYTIEKKMTDLKSNIGKILITKIKKQTN